MAGDPASTPGPHRRDAKHRGSAASALTWSPATPWSHPCGPGAGREHSESGPVGQPRSHWKPQACPALRLGRGRTGEAPLGHSPSRLRSRPVPTRHRHYLIPTEEQSPPGAGRHPPPPTLPRWDSREHSHKLPFLATVPGMRLAPATAPWHSRAPTTLLGSGGCPPLPLGMHSQGRAGPGAPHTAPRH